MEFEREFCIAQAKESLDELCRKIILETYILDYKKAYGHGQKQGTKSAKLLKDLTYQHAQLAMEVLSSCIIRLGWQAVYQPLDFNDTRPALTNNTEGEGRQKLSWIWMAPWTGKSSSPEHVQEGLMLSTGLKSHKAKQWKKCAEMSVEGTNGGTQAFVLRQSLLWIAMHDNCAQLWNCLLEWLTLGMVPDEDIEMR
ncbi:hypothetical protein EDD85DRAFT_795019 [Armillaria nabsnona]|nr:hypothetical protein EDD85DRAFT_795019 [Armillaria nabsnona]